MSETGNISFKVNSTFDGEGVYRIFSEPGCDLSDLILSGTTNIINGSADVNIIEPLTLNQNISISFEDSKGCDICNDFEITILTTSTTTLEPTTTSTTTLEPTTTSTTTLEPIV